MASSVSSIAAILLSTVLFLMGGGLIGTLTPVRAGIEGFSNISVGGLGTGYYAGFVAGCYVGPLLLARVGHIRAFGVAAALTAVSILLQPIVPIAVAWFALRGIAGFCAAILFMAVESWLNDRATNETRGRLLSIYVVLNLSAVMLGQWLLLLSPPNSYPAFTIGAVLYCLCLVPMGLTRLPPPQVQSAPKLNVSRIFRIAPVGAAGCLTVGLANGAFWILAPIYVESLGFSTSGLALFMSIFIAGGALVQWPLGRASDTVDRRWIIAGICVAASLGGIALGLFGWYLIRTPALFYGIVFALGAAMLPLYSLSIAHANDRLPREEFIEASAGLLMINAASSIPAPLLAAFVISVAGPYSLFLYTAIAHAAMAFFAFTRIRIREAVPAAERDAFKPVAQSSPAALPLDPRGPAQEKTT